MLLGHVHGFRLPPPDRMLPVPEGSDWTDYVKSVDYIESQTGLDLLSSLPDDLETRIERSEYIPQAV